MISLLGKLQNNATSVKLLSQNLPKYSLDTSNLNLRFDNKHITSVSTTNIQLFLN